MSIKRIFIVISAIFAASAVFADNSSVTSKKYVDDLMSGYQGKLPGSGANKLMIYDDEAGIGEKAIAATLGNSASAVSVPTVGAVKTGLDGKQDTITGTAGYVMTGTGTPGEVGERAIYSANTNYSNALVTAETVNTGVVNAVNNSLIRVNENGIPSETGMLWEINTNLFAFNFLPQGYTQLAYLQGDGNTRIIPDVTINSNLMVDIKYEIITSGWLFGGTLGAEGRWGLTSGTSFYSGTTGVADISSAINLAGINIATFDYKTGAIVNGVNIPFNSVQNYGNVTKKAFYLFTADGTGVSTQEHKIYYTKIYDNNTLIRDMIPVRRESDGVLGMYDTVSGLFFTNRGTGNFTAGPSCISPNLFDKNNLTRIYGFFPSSNSSWTYAEAGYSVRIPCKPNTTYTARYNGAGTQVVLSFASTSSDDYPKQDRTTVTVTQSIRQNSPTSNTPITLTTGPGDKWLIVAYNVAEPQNTDMADNLQIEEGSTATTYRPYGENICD